MKREKERHYMSDSVERARRFIIAQRARQDQERAAKEIWCKKVPDLAKHAEAIVQVFHEAGHKAVFVQAREDQILVKFGDRQRRYVAGEEIAHLVVDRPSEEGALAEFHFDSDSCKVVGHRNPFYIKEREGKQPLRRFVEFEDVENLSEKDFGNAVMDFLEWACVGEGRGSWKIRF
jgi:hypothetical protein